MKRVKKILFALIMSLLFTGTAHAATANIRVSASSSQVVIGNSVTIYVTISSSSPLGTWEYGLNYDSTVFNIDSKESLHIVDFAENNATKTKTYTYTFTAVSKGSSTFSVGSAGVIGFDENEMTLSSSSVTVNSITYNEYQASLSTNNNLASLKIEEAEIDPEFDKDTLEYNAKVSEDTKEINITATPEDNTASVSGTGPQAVSPGNNIFEIYVVAQNGSEKIYKLNVEVIDKNPIEIKMDNDKYTVVKIRDNLTSPKGFKESTINIGEFEIPAYYSDIMKITVVGLKDDDGKIIMATYQDGKYEKYYEINLGNITIRPLEMQETLSGYVKGNLKINNISIECLQKAPEDRYKYIYAINVETNEEGLYTVDTKDNTIMKLDKEEKKESTEKTKMLFYVTCAFAGTTLLSFIVIISLLNKKPKKTDSKPKEDKKELTKTKKKKVVCPECHQEYNAKEKTCPYCAQKSQEKDTPIEDAPQIQEEKEVTKEVNIEPDITITEPKEEPIEEEVYDIFEDEHNRKKQKKEKKAKKHD